MFSFIQFIYCKKEGKIQEVENQIAEDETKTWLPVQTSNALTKLFGDASFRSFVRMLIMENRKATFLISSAQVKT